MIKGLSARGVGIGVRDADGVGGGNGLSRGVPCGCCKFRGGRREAAVGFEDEIGGSNSADEEDGVDKKEEGLIRRLNWSLPLERSEESFRGIG